MNQTLPDFEAILMDIHSSNASLFDDHNCRYNYHYIHKTFSNYILIIIIIDWNIK